MSTLGGCCENIARPTGCSRFKCLRVTRRFRSGPIPAICVAARASTVNDRTAMAGSHFQMHCLQHILVALCRGLAMRARPRLMRRPGVIDVRKRALEAGQIEDRPCHSRLASDFREQLVSNPKIAGKTAPSEAGLTSALRA